MSVRSSVSVVMTCCCFVVEGIASWTEGVIPICGVLTGGGACSLIVENRVTGFLTGGVDGRFTPEMPVIWMPGPWVTAALRTGDRPAALSRGGSYWAHRFFMSEIENKNHWAGQVQVVPPFWSL